MVVNVYPDDHDRHYFLFHLPRIEIIQPTRMLEEAGISSFTFNKLIKIILGLISAPQAKLLLLHKKTTRDSAIFIFYIDDIFEAFKTYQK